MLAEVIGWCSAAVLLITIARQVHAQWRSGSTQGMSRWLFIGQLAASTGFIIYSWMVRNWVFVVTNVLMLATAAIGQWIYLRNVRREKSRK
jgi:uncharacterized protein with PQ loop repeat